MANKPPTEEKHWTPKDTIRKAFSFPTDEEIASLDTFECVCRECGASWEIILLHHTMTRGTVNSLIAHAMSHQGQGRPGMRRIS